MNAHMGSRGLKKRVSDERDVLANFNNTSPHASSATAGRAQDDPYGSNPRGRVVFKANTTTAPSKSSQPIKYSRSLSQLSASASTDELLALAYQQHPDEQPGSGKNAKSKPTNSSLTRLNEDRYYLDPERLAQPDQRDLITQNGAYGGHIRDWTPRESMYASDQTYYSKNRSKHAIKERYMVAFKEKPVDYTGISRAEEAKEARRSVEKKQYMQFIKDEEKVRKFQRKWSTSLQSLPPTLSIAEAKAEQARHARLTELKAKWKILRKDVEDYTKVAQLQMSFYDQD